MNLIAQEYGPSIDTLFFSSLVHILKHRGKMLCWGSCQHSLSHCVQSSYKQLSPGKWPLCLVAIIIPNSQTNSVMAFAEVTTV